MTAALLKSATSYAARVRMHHLFARGTMAAYGWAFDDLFTFKRVRDGALVDVAIHCRSTKIRGGWEAFFRQVGLVLAGIAPCRMFVASDSPVKAVRHSRYLQCAPVTIGADATRHTYRSIAKEHGTRFEGFIEEIDVLLRAPVFIGTIGSSASELIASIAVHRNHTCFMCSPAQCVACHDADRVLGSM